MRRVQRWGKALPTRARGEITLVERLLSILERFVSDVMLTNSLRRAPHRLMLCIRSLILAFATVVLTACYGASGFGAPCGGA